jgi:carboxypeptidase T
MLRWARFFAYRGDRMKLLITIFAALISLPALAGKVHLEPSQDAEKLFWLKAKAETSKERSALADQGLSLEIFSDDYVIILGPERHKALLQQKGLLLSSYEFQSKFWDFPQKDANFHNYDELNAELKKLADENPTLLALDSIGKTVEGREISHLRISKDIGSSSSTKPGIVFIGGHHAREHLSIEIPLMLAQHLIAEYKLGNQEIVSLVDNRDIHIIPMLNADGAEFDIADGRYKMWRKNRRDNKDGRFGVDLNRNYGFMWGTGGSSSYTGDDTYKGTQPFSEPETQAFKKFIETHDNINVLLSFHSFSELILYPWGHTNDPLPDQRDQKVYETMAQKMATWNGYTPQAAADLYIASGDTVDWVYGQHKVFGFTFELDPTSMWNGGFYPGQRVIPTVFQKNLRPALYLIDLADNPYRVLETQGQSLGLSW